VESANELLDQMGQAGAEQGYLGPRGGVTKARPPKIRYTHDAMIDLVIADGGVSQNKIAEVFGYTPGWVSTVFTSDGFKMRLAQRKAEIVDPVLQMALKERIEGLAAQSLSILMEKISKPAEEVPDQLALQAFNAATKALGLGGHAPQAAPPVTEDRLAKLAHRLEGLLGRPVESEVVDIPSREIAA